jgi:alkylation response protein AidB-like acyl-CoA dehydrogenase
MAAMTPQGVAPEPGRSTAQVADDSLVLESVDRLIADLIAPQAAEIDATARFPREIYEAMGAIGLFGLWIDEEDGGLGKDIYLALMVEQRIARVSATCALMFANCGDAVSGIVHGGATWMRQKYLPGIAAGELIPCFALTEPQAGSDAAGIKTRAVRQGSEYVLNGNKIYITNGSVGDIYVVYAMTSPDAGSAGMSAFLVPRDTPGFTVGRDEDLLGLRGSPATELHFDNLVIPEDHRLGDEDTGFRLAMVSLDDARLSAAAISLGIAHGAMDIAVAYATEREQFGKKIIDHQGLQFLLAERVSELAAGRALLDQATELVATAPSRRASTFASMAKLICTDYAMQATVDALQVMGGFGLTRECPVERMMRDAKAFQIFDGTNQIQKMIIGRYLRRSGLPFD